MHFVRSASGPRRSLLVLVGIVCVALLLVSGVVQATHFHENGQIDHDCSLCISAHNAIQIVFAVSLVLLSLRVVHGVAERFAPIPRQRFVLKLANRPPPEEPAFA